MNDPRLMRVEHAKYIREGRVHFLGRHRTTIASDTESAHVGVTPEHFAAGKGDEKHRFDTAAVERLQHVGRAGEIVAVVRQKQVD